MTEEDVTASIPSRFNDVADTVDISGNYMYSMSSPSAIYVDAENGQISTAAGARYGIEAVGGGRTRDGAIENEDTLSTYVALGLSYSYHDSLPAFFAGDDKTPPRYMASTPRGEFDVGVAYFEDWAGKSLDVTDLDDWGVVFRGLYQLQGQWFPGVLANGGKGPDEISVFFGTRKSIEDLLQFIGMTP